MTIPLATGYTKLYSATMNPEIIDVPDLTYLMLDGSAAPGTEEFDRAVKTMYQVAYGVLAASDPVSDHPVMPLEALWGSASDVYSHERTLWHWTLMILQPAVTADKIGEVLDKTVQRLRKSAPDLPADEVRIGLLSEGRCVQALHVGPYTDEPRTIARMLAFSDANGYTTAGRHHEIYLSDPDRTAPEWLRTILRVPIVPRLIGFAAKARA